MAALCNLREKSHVEVNITIVNIMHRKTFGDVENPTVTSSVNIFAVYRFQYKIVHVQSLERLTKCIKWIYFCADL